VEVGIVGKPGAGRTTVFRALLAHRAPRAEGSRGGEVGAIHVQDPRLERLSERFRPEKTTPIEILVHDVCASLEPAFPTAELETMKRMDVLLLVVPAFADPSPAASAAAFEELLAELCLEDMALVERQLKTAARDRLAEPVRQALAAAESALEATRPVAALDAPPPVRDALRAYNLITDRPLLVLRNVGEAQAADPVPDALVQAAAARGMPALALCAALEAEMAGLPPAERAEFLAAYGVAESAGAAVTRAVLAAGDVIPFFTVGEDECRAWPVRRGTGARRAAGRIHSDIERGFIRAEVVPASVLDGLPGGLVEARKLGLLRLEGKDYVVQDGDVIHFRFNV
jgi:ribosome-binding ATPase YchF (GTP1/OBG family)